MRGKRCLTAVSSLLLVGAFSVAGVSAALPATAGTVGSQFRVSYQGYDGNTSYQARDPAVAYDSATHQQLVVFANDDSGVYLIKGQFVDATGSLVGVNFAISPSSGAGALDTIWPNSPAVAYDSQNEQFLVAWYTGGSLFAQRVASNGTLVGSTIAVSASSYSFETVAIAWSEFAHEYLVVWGGNSSQAYGRLVSSTDGSVEGTQDLQISHATGSDYQDDAVDVAYNTADRQFFVVWKQWIDSDGRFEIRGQRVLTNGTDVSATDLAISQQSAGDANRPRVVYVPRGDRYFVVFSNGDGTGTEVFGQLVGFDATLIGSNFQISSRGEQVRGPDVAYDQSSDAFLVTYQGGPGNSWAGSIDGQIYGDYVTGIGGVVGTPDFQISAMTVSGYRPAVDVNASTHEFLTTWFGYTTSGSLDTYQGEVWGQRVAPPTAANDNYANAITLAGGSGTTVGINAGATAETGEPSLGGTSVWWKWTAPFTGRATFSTEYSDFDTLLGVYTGSAVNTLTPLAYNDDYYTDGQSRVEFDVTSGTVYYIAVGGFSGDTGAISLAWAVAPAVDAHTPTDNATGVVVSTVITAHFVQPVDNATLTLTGKGPKIVATATGLPGSSISFTLSKALMKGKTYTATVSTSVSTPVAVTSSHTWSFTMAK